MLSCKQVATVASQYLDREVNTPLKWQIRWHLMMCANCRRFMRHLRVTQAVARETPLAETPVDSEKIWQELQQKINQDSRPD